LKTWRLLSSPQKDIAAPAIAVLFQLIRSAETGQANTAQINSCYS